MSDTPLGAGTLPIGMGRIQGIVVGADDKGLGNVLVTLSIGTGKGSIFTRPEAAGRGKWMFSGLAYGTYQITAELEGYAPAAFTAVASATPPSHPYKTVLQRL